MLRAAGRRISRLINAIKKVPPTSIVVMQGAGVSVAAGIPDFRTPKIGFYDIVKEMGLEEPEKIFDIQFFKENPYAFYRIGHLLLPGKYKPTTAHYFSTLLERKGKLLRLFTQNIDGLEAMAGVSEDRLVEAHGHFRSAHCARCGFEAEIDVVLEAIRQGRPVRCPCGSWAKPDVVFFGQDLPKRFFQMADQDMEKCQLLIVMGTSLQVEPFASLADYVPKGIPRFLVNKEMAGCRWDFRDQNSGDYFVKGDCQEACQAIIEAMGWTKDLQAVRSTCAPKQS